MSEELKRNIVVIDDDAMVRQALGDGMESAGYRVESFGSAEDFLASESGQNAACLIVDIELPGITGLELQGKLAGANKHAPIVCVSAQGTKANRENALRNGAADFVPNHSGGKT